MGFTFDKSIIILNPKKKPADLAQNEAQSVVVGWVMGSNHS